MDEAIARATILAVWAVGGAVWLWSFLRALALRRRAAEELWESYGHSESLSRARWPEFNAELAREEEIEVAVQINGKLRTRIFANPAASEDELREAALADEKVKAATEGRDVAKIIIVPRKLVNVVLK